jgi:hypothetical protein
LKDLNQDDELERIRNETGGHVDSDAIVAALNTMPLAEVGKYELGKSMKETHFGFAGNLIVQIFLQDVSRKDHHKYLERVFSLNRHTTEVYRCHFYLVPRT